MLIDIVYRIASVLVAARGKVHKYEDVLRLTISDLDKKIDINIKNKNLAAYIEKATDNISLSPNSGYKGDIPGSYHKLLANQIDKQELGSCSGLLQDIDIPGEPKTWLLHIEERIRFDFDSNYESGYGDMQSLKDMGLIKVGNSVEKLSELFLEQSTRKKYIEAYAKWGKYAWNGLSVSSPNSSERLIVLVWPRVWCNTLPCVSWEDVQSRKLFGDLPIKTNFNGDTEITASPHVEVRLTGNSSVGDSVVDDHAIWRALMNDVVIPNKVQPLRTNVPRSLKSGANASHEFGHMITSPHSTRRDEIDIMYFNATYQGKNGNNTGAIHCLAGPLKWAYDKAGGPGGELDWLKTILEINNN